jgi:hypothetical protein
MLAARITLAHFSVSSPTTLPKSMGEPDNAVALLLNKRGQIERASCYWVGDIHLNTSFCIPAVVCAR